MGPLGGGTRPLGGSSCWPGQGSDPSSEQGAWSGGPLGPCSVPDEWVTACGSWGGSSGGTVAPLVGLCARPSTLSSPAWTLVVAPCPDAGEDLGSFTPAVDPSPRAVWGGHGPLTLGTAPAPQPSVYELVRAPGFAHLPLVVEDFVKDAGACFSGERLG